MIKSLLDALNARFVGKSDVVRKVVITMLAGGHVLLEDVPGVGKTTLAKLLAKSVDCDFGRIQFTPDTLPTDVTGMSIYNMKTNEFVFHEGGIMHQIVLADEINRTSPKTQASLLEGMAEGKISVDGNTYLLPEPFFVIATQNPCGSVGTYALPEASVDRFMMKLSIGYPDKSEEFRMAGAFLTGEMQKEITPVLHVADILSLKEKVQNVKVHDLMIMYAINIIEATRQEKRFVMGASPRALLHLLRAAQAAAFVSGAEFVRPDDIKDVAVEVLHHRLQLTAQAKLAKESADQILKHILMTTKIPREGQDIIS